MDTRYLDTLPEIYNVYGAELEYGEKVVFTAKLTSFTNERGTKHGWLNSLGVDSMFTMTNRKIVANNGVGIWTADIAEDIISCKKVDKKHLFYKDIYFEVLLNCEIIYQYDTKKMTGFHFYFNDEDTLRFENIIRYL